MLSPKFKVLCQNFQLVLGGMRQDFKINLGAATDGGGEGEGEDCSLGDLGGGGCEVGGGCGSVGERSKSVLARAS